MGLRVGGGIDFAIVWGIGGGSARGYGVGGSAIIVEWGEDFDVIDAIGGGELVVVFGGYFDDDDAFEGEGTGLDIPEGFVVFDGHVIDDGDEPTAEVEGAEELSDDGLDADAFGGAVIGGGGEGADDVWGEFLEEAFADFDFDEVYAGVEFPGAGLDSFWEAFALEGEGGEHAEECVKDEVMEVGGFFEGVGFFLFDDGGGDLFVAAIDAIEGGIEECLVVIEDGHGGGVGVVFDGEEDDLACFVGEVEPAWEGADDEGGFLVWFFGGDWDPGVGGGGVWGVGGDFTEFVSDGD